MKKTSRGCRPLAVPSKAGFTLVELMIVVAIVGILGALIIPAALKASSGNPDAFTDLMQGKECINGYLFVTDANQSRIQVIGANGGGVPCR